MNELLFNPNGRIKRNRFWQGMIVLTVASILVTAGSVLVNEHVGMLSILLWYCYICVFGKRLHDSGRSAWWSLAVGAGMVIAQTFLMLLFMLFLWPGFMTAEQQQVLKEIFDWAQMGDSAEVSRGLEYLIEISSVMFLRVQIALTAVVNGAFAYWIGALQSTVGENRFGPEPEVRI